MKTINLVECRTCGTKIFDETKPVTITPSEEIDFLIKVVGKCDVCKGHDPRTTSGGRKLFRGV
jgi:hypothetical protein